MARKKIIRISGDVREHPRYSLEEAAGYLRIPLSTLTAWTRGQNYVLGKTGKRRHFDPVLQLADQKRGLLSFYNLAEAHILRATRDRDVPLVNVRKALEYIRESISSSRHPLLTQEFMISGKSVFIEHLGDTINATKYGQLAMRDVLEHYLDRIDRDAEGMPFQIRPMNTRYIAINPSFSSGQPVVKGTRIMAGILAARKRDGESYAALVRDYGLTKTQIEQAIVEIAAC
ncbi:MAG: DUF433 domain-containing protein [Terracidiphilus sp.]|jgi:uncharacterized protein (DUF433 family)